MRPLASLKAFEVRDPALEVIFDGVVLEIIPDQGAMGP